MAKAAYVHPSWPSKEMSTLGSVPRSTTKYTWAPSSRRGCGSPKHGPALELVLYWQCLGELGTLVAWSSCARASKGTSVCPVAEQPNPVSLVTPNEVMSSQTE